MTTTARRTWWLAVAVAAIAAVPFLPTLQNGFVSWDDDKNFLTNPAYRGLGFDQLRWMWTTFHLGHYVPMSWMTLGLDYSLWGMDARGYHLTSLVLHAANAALVFLLSRRLLAKAFDSEDAAVTVGAAFAALWFAIHPLRVESVAWVTERRDVLSGLLYSATLLAYLGAVEGAVVNRRRYWMSVALFAMALLSKATAMTLPAVLILLNYYPLRRLSPGDTGAVRRLAGEIAPFAMLAVGAMVLSIVALHPGEQLSAVDKLAVSAYGLAFYIWKSLVPTGLAAYYPLPRDLQLGAPAFLAAFATLAAMAVVTWRLWRKARGAAVAIAAFVMIVLPMLGVVQNGPQLAADRYTYHAAPALAVLVGAAVVIGWRRRALLTGVLAASVLLALAGLTWRQTQSWHDSYSLWTRVLVVSDDAAIAHNALGNLLMEQERPSLALEHYDRAARLDPSLAAAHDNLGVALARLGRPSESITHFERAVQDHDEASKAYANWGVALMQLGNFQDAVDRFGRAAALDTLNANIESNWGSAFARVGALDSALAHFTRASAIDPRHAQARFNRGAVLARLGKWPEAATELEIAVSLDSTDADARASLERVRQELARQRRPGRAP